MSQIQPAFTGQISKQGGLTLDDPVRWRSRLVQLRGKRVKLVIASQRQLRSRSQNAYLWGVVYALLAEWSGHTPEEIHEAMKLRYLSRRIKLGSEAQLTTASTTDLNTEEFAHYVDEVRRFAAEQGLSIPDADEVEVVL